MSVNKISLKHPALIGLVVVGLAVVIVVNVRMFDTKRIVRPSRSTLEGRMTSEGSDALAFLSGVVNSGELAFADSVVMPDGFEWPEQVRDPFRSAAVSAVKNRTRQRPRSVVVQSRPSRCDAVLLQGIDPIALIDGQPYKIGDKIQGSVVVRINTEGVTLSKNLILTKLAVVEGTSTGAGFSVVMKNSVQQRRPSLPAGNHQEHGGGR